MRNQVNPNNIKVQANSNLKKPKLPQASKMMNQSEATTQKGKSQSTMKSMRMNLKMGNNIKLLAPNDPNKAKLLKPCSLWVTSCLRSSLTFQMKITCRSHSKSSDLLLRTVALACIVSTMELTFLDVSLVALKPTNWEREVMTL